MKKIIITILIILAVGIWLIAAGWSVSNAPFDPDYWDTNTGN